MAQNPFLIEEETTAPANPFVTQADPVAVNPFLVQEEQPVAQANPFLVPEEPVVPEALTTDFGDVTSERTYPIAQAEVEAGVNPFAALEVIDRPRAAVASSLIATLEGSDAETIKAEAAKGISGEQHPMMGEYFSKKAKQVVENPTEYPTLSKVFSGVDALFSEAVKKYQVGMTPIRLATSGVYADLLKIGMADTEEEKAAAREDLTASLKSVFDPLVEAYTSDTAGLDALAYTAGFGVDVAIDPVTYTNPILSFTKKGKILIPDAVLDQYAKAANTTKQKAKDVLTRTKTGQSLTEAANYAWNLFSTKNQFKNKPKVEELRENFLNLIASGRVQAIREGREFQDRIKVFARETNTTEKEVEMFITEAVERGGVNNVKLADLSDEAIDMLSKDDNIRYEVWSLSQRNADQLAKEIDAGVTITPLSEQPLLRVGDEDDALLLAYFNRAVTPDARKAINAKREAKGYKPIAEGGEGPTNMSGRHSSTIARNEEWEGLTINDINEMAKRGELPGYEGQVFKDGFFYSDPAVSQALRDSKHYRAIASRDLADQIIDPANNISIAPDKLIQAAQKSGWQPKTKNPTVVGALRYLKKNRKGWDRWEVSNNPMTEGYVMDREIVDFVDGNLNKIYDPQEINKFLDVTDQVTNWWKAWTLSIFPSYHFRNEVGNVWNNFVMDVNPKFYQEAAKIQEAVMGSQITPPRWGKVGRTPTVSEGPLPAYTKFKTPDGTEYTYTQLRDMMDEQGIIGKGFMATDIESTLRSEMGDAKWLTLSRENKAIEVGKRIGEGLENNARMANFLDGLSKGLSPEQAAARVRKTLFDYSDLTKFEQDVMKRIMPFYTWTRKNVPFQIEQMIKKPGRYKAIDTLRQEIESAVSEEDTNERYLASWMLENMPTKVKIDEETGEPRYFILGGWLPAADAWKLAAAPARVFKDNLHPGIKMMYERISADEDGYVTDLFTGQKLHPKLQQNFVGVDMPETVAHDLKNIRLLATMDDFIQAVRNSESDQKIIKVLQGDHILGKAEKKLSPFARQPKTVEESLIAFLTGFRTYAVNLDQQKMFAGMDEEQKIQQLQKLYMQSAKRGSAQPELIEEAKDVATEAQQKFAKGGLISQLRKRYAEGGLADRDPLDVSTEGVDMSSNNKTQEEQLAELGIYLTESGRPEQQDLPFEERDDRNLILPHYSKETGLVAPKIVSEVANAATRIGGAATGEPYVDEQLIADVTTAAPTTSFAAGKITGTVAEPGSLYAMAGHISPHKFEKFDMSKLGSGEGHQAIAHGLYFYTKDKVGDNYIAQFNHARSQVKMDIKALEQQLDPRLRKSDEEVAQIRQRLFEKQDQLAQMPRGGVKYTVDLDLDDTNTLDWTKEVGKQSDLIKNALPKIKEKLGDDFIEYVEDALNDTIEHFTGQELYRTLVKYASENPLVVKEQGKYAGMTDVAAEDATAFLSQLGIRGVKYPAGELSGKRFRDVDAPNYVVFDDKYIKVLDIEEGPTSAALTAVAKADEGKDAFKLLNTSLDEKAAWRKANAVKQKQSQTPELAEQAQKLFEGKITGDEFRAKAAELRPHTTFEEVTKMPTFEEIVYSLKDNQVETGIVGLNKTIPDGTEVASRLDIPAYEGFDTWVVSLHDSGGRTPKGKSIGYGKTALLNDVEFGTAPKGALSIARNKTNKTTIGRIYGKWENHDSDDIYRTAQELIKDPEWTQVGMNPYRASYFYDKKTLEPVVSADQVVQVGPVVLAKGVKKVSPNDPRFRFDKNSEQTFADGGLAEEADGNLNEGMRPEMDMPVEQPQQEVVIQAEQPQKPSIKMPPKQQKKDHVEEYLDNLAMVESSGDTNAYAETSGALGLYQFVPKTWESMVDRYMPELKQQKGDYMEFRRNPEVSRYMARKLMEENQNILKKKGFNDTKGNLYLAHFAGPSAALNVLRAKPNTPVQDVLSAGQIKRNPGVFSKVKTTDQLIKWAQSKILLEKFKKKR